MKDLSLEETKLLGKIADIGAEKASEALSAMSKKKVKISISWAGSYAIEKIPKTISSPHRIVTAVYLDITDDVKGCVLLILPKDSALLTSDLLQNKEIGTTKELDKMDESAIKEMGNILTNAYLNVLSSTLNIHLLDSVPHIATDMSNAVISSVLSQYADRAENVIALKTGIIIEKHDIKSHILIFFDPNSYSLLVKKLRKCKIR